MEACSMDVPNIQNVNSLKKHNKKSRLTGFFFYSCSGVGSGKLGAATSAPVLKLFILIEKEPESSPPIRIFKSSLNYISYNKDTRYEKESIIHLLYTHFNSSTN